LLNGEESGIRQCEFFGKRIIENELFWFLKYNDYVIKGNVEDYYTKKSLIKMTREEFANFYFTGKCSIFNIGIAFGIFNILKKYNLKLYSSFIKEIYIVYIDITNNYITNVLSFQYPIPDKDDNNNKDWDCDRVHKKSHQAIVVLLDNNKTYLLDFTAAQYGIYSQTPEKNWFHIEELNGHCFTYGSIDKSVVIDNDLIKKIESEDDQRADIIKKIKDLICNIK